MLDKFVIAQKSKANSDITQIVISVEFLQLEPLNVIKSIQQLVWFIIWAAIIHVVFSASANA